MEDDENVIRSVRGLHQGDRSSLTSVIDERGSTRAYYEANAADYAARTLTLSVTEALGAFLATLPQGAMIVDLGCGAGRDLEVIARQGRPVVGLDLAESLARIARRHSGAPVVVADMRQMPFPDETFDGAWAAASLLHLARAEIPGSLTEIRRILKVGGRLFTSVKSGANEQQDSDGRWFTYFDPQEWHASVHAAGFEVERLDVQVGGSSQQGAWARWINCWARRR
ncbi:class I SAM-dependent methyltransferase [Mesorhizobium sp.]|uniref:class I SAM-dependent methyltransferase n=1 Tax=Mesorhizobium sp. TaxID=1871066 RepID=UPI00257C0B4F|nr:class I SAM-dependent methyltransferase [Mesorhizobium sp.]